MKRSLHILLLAAALSPGLYAQEQFRSHRCGSAEHLEAQLQQYPDMRQTREELERLTEEYMSHPENARMQGGAITIPVVFHVVYRTSGENIPDQRLLDQLQVLNDDYRKLNADAVNIPSAWQSIAADCEVNFCLAVRDPQGNATTGITRTLTSTVSFSMNNNVKFTSTGGKDIWDRNKYLNIWVCNLSGGLLGYAQFPGGPSATDGVVLNYRYVGTTGAQAPYNKGRTATHEVGHWLNLLHIWGDDGGSCSQSDGATDTPNQGDENYTCHAPGTVITDNCATSAPGIMWMNYMDYTDDACMYMFTNNQKTRVQTALNGSRSSILTSNGCTPVSVPELRLAAAFNVYPSPSTGQFTLDLGNSHTQQLELEVFDMLGRSMYHKNFDAITETKLKLDLAALASGVYFIQADNGTDKVLRKVTIQK